jgi:RHS repeat-associated protein
VGTRRLRWAARTDAERQENWVPTQSVGTRKPGATLGDGLLGLWSFLETEGTSTADLSTSGNDGTIYGSPVRQAPWQNPSNRFDINGDGYVAPQDALILANFLYFNGSLELPPAGSGTSPFPASPPPYYDVNGDNWITSADAAIVIDYLRDGISITSPTSALGTPLTLDGTNDYVSLGDPAELDITGAITLSAWVRVDDTTGTRDIIVHGDDGSANGQVFLRVKDGQFEVGSYNGTEHKASYAVAAAIKGQWVHLTGVYDATAQEWRLYLDGSLVATSSDATGAVAADGNWAIGASGSGTAGFFCGSLDEVRVYNRALSTDEIAQLAGTAAPATTDYEYDHLGRLVTQLDPDPDGAGALTRPETTYTYDDLGNVLTLTDPEENTTTWTYDALNRQVTETNELDDARSFEYDALGRLVRRVDGLGRVRQFQYDDLGRNTAEVWYNDTTDADADQNRVRTIELDYDAAGRMTAVDDAEADYSFAYDALDRVTSITQSIEGLTPVVTLAQEFDARGLRTELLATLGQTADFLDTWTYDNLGRTTQLLQQATVGGDTVADKRVDFTWDAAGQPLSLDRFASLAGNNEVAVSDYVFDQLGRLTDLTHSKDQTTLVDYDWTFDGSGNLTSYQNSIDGLVDYTYDATDQLTGADYDYQADEAYTYDENGNRTNAGYVTGPNNQLLSDGVYRYAYDAEGNRSLRYVDEDESGTLTSGDTDITAYAWDHRNRLTAVTHYEDYADYDAATPDSVVEYAYDFGNRWVRRIVNPGENEEKTIFVYDGNQIVAELTDTGAADLTADDLAHRYLWGPAVDQLLADETVTDLQTEGEILWPLGDHLNTVRDLAAYDDLTDTTTIANHRVYDAYGNVTSETNAAVDCVFGYTGRPFDETTALQNNLNRWYDATTGRWMSEDPIAFRSGDENLYRYVGNLPTGCVDPMAREKSIPKSPEKDEMRLATRYKDTNFSRADLVAKIIYGDSGKFTLRVRLEYLRKAGVMVGAVVENSLSMVVGVEYEPKNPKDFKDHRIRLVVAVKRDEGWMKDTLAPVTTKAGWRLSTIVLPEQFGSIRGSKQQPFEFGKYVNDPSFATYDFSGFAEKSKNSSPENASLWFSSLVPYYPVAKGTLPGLPGTGVTAAPQEFMIGALCFSRRFKGGGPPSNGKFIDAFRFSVSYNIENNRPGLVVTMGEKALQQKPFEGVLTHVYARTTPVTEIEAAYKMYMKYVGW